MGVGDKLVAIAALSVAESYVLQRTVLPSHVFLSLLLWAFWCNISLKMIYDVIIYPYFLNPLRHLPHIKGSFLSTKIILDSPRGRIPLQWMKTVPNEGLIHFYGPFNQSFLLATNHQALLDIMSTHTYDFEKPWRVRDFLARIIGFGLILSEGATHKKQRKALTPAFNIKNIRSLYSLMWEKTGLLLDELDKEIQANQADGGNLGSGAGKVELSMWASRLTLDIIGPTAMGRDFLSLQNKKNRITDCFLEILEPSKEKITFLAINFILPQWFAKRMPSKHNDMIETEVGYLRRVCHEIVTEKRAALAASKMTAQELETDILGTMLAGENFTDNELVDQMLTFLAAGHETTASALTWACYLLCQHPNVQQQLRAEIRERIPSHNSPITWNDLESMPLLNGVCQEVLRLYPTVPATIRESVRDTVVAGKRIPKDTRILIVPYAVNRSPEFWGDNGEEFIPERWIDTDKTGRQIVNHHGGTSTNFSQITFLHGQRACIGKDFARAELRCAIAGVVGRFKFEMQDPKQEIHIAGAVTTKPVEGMHLNLKSVPGW